MEYVIRQGLFETNSSSCHSITVIKNGKLTTDNVFPILSDNKVHAEFGEFGWGPDRYTDPYHKLQYALTMALETEIYYKIPHNVSNMRIKSKKDYYNCESFKMINDLIKKECHCDGVEIDSDIELDGSWLRYDGYIDHQSRENYNNLEEFLKDHEITLKDFIFDTSKVLIIDNDN